jgi:hypothetical protein
MADAYDAEPLGETELDPVIHRGVAGRRAEDAAVPGDGVPGDGCQDGALAGARRTVDAEQVARGETALHGEALLRVQGIEALGRSLGLDARRLLAEEHVPAAARSASIGGGHLDDGCVGAGEGDVVRHEIQDQAATADEFGRGAIERELHAAAASPGDERALGCGDLGTPGTCLHDVTGAEGVPPGLAAGAGERDEEAASEPHVLVGGLEVAGGEAERLPLALGEPGALAGEALLLGAALEREEAAQTLEVLGPGWSCGHAPSCPKIQGHRACVEAARRVTPHWTPEVRR